MDQSRRNQPGPVAKAVDLSIESGRRRERFELTAEARGPWSEDAAHGGAPAALFARAAELHGREDGLRLAGLQATFNGPVPLGEVAIESETVKPGRRQQIVALRLTAGSRTLMEARAVLLRRGRMELPAGASGEAGEHPLGAPGRGREIDQSQWAGGAGPAFHRSANRVVAIEGGPDRIGATGSAWFRLESPLLEGEPASGAQRAVAAADFGNGVAHPVPFGEYLFVNCDLTVSLLREPLGEWIGIRAATAFDPGGAGITATGLFDREGPVGSAGQTLYVDRV